MKSERRNYLLPRATRAIFILTAVFLCISMPIMFSMYTWAAQNAVALSEEKLTLKVGEQKQVFLLVGGKKEAEPNDSASDWQSTNAAVAAVSSNGVIKAVAAGNAVISCMTSYMYRVSCKVTVTGASGTGSGGVPGALGDPTGTGYTDPGTGTGTGTGTATTAVKVVKGKYIKTIGQAKKTYRLENYLNKSCKNLVRLTKYAYWIDKTDDMAGLGNLYEFGRLADPSMSLRFNKKNKRIIYLLNNRIKNLSIYGIKITTSEGKADRLLAKKGFKYSSQEFSSPGYWRIYKKGKVTIKLYIVSGQVRRFQWNK